VISHRLASADDRRFVIASWSASFKGSYAAGMIYSDGVPTKDKHGNVFLIDYADIMHAQIGRVLEQQDTRTYVAFESKDPTFLYGFIAGDTSDAVPTVFYVYVKLPYRKHGIAHGLFGALGVDPKQNFIYACRTDDSTRLSDKIPRARWNPLVARYSKENARRWPP